MFRKFFLGELAQVALFHTCHNQPRWNVSLYTHDTHPRWNNPFDFRGEVCGFFSCVGLVSAFLVPLVRFGAVYDEAGINLYHVRLIRWVSENPLERFQIFGGRGTWHARHHVVNYFQPRILSYACGFLDIGNGMGPTH